MKRIVIALLLMLGVLASQALAQQTAPNGQAGATLARPALWKISDADSEIWLFGTVHMLDPSLTWRYPALDQAINQAQTFVFEAPTDPQGEAAAARYVAQYARNAPGKTLSSQLSRIGQKRLQRVSADLGIPVQQIDQFRPWFAGIVLSATWIQKQGSSPDAGVEQVLGAEAKARGASMQYLETIEQQLGYLSGMSPKAEVAFLDLALQDMVEDPKSLDRLMVHWLNADLDGMAREIFDHEAQAPEVYDALFTRRNRAWAAQIKQMLAGSGKIFIGVGAGHLVGTQGVPALLRAQGIEPVRQ
ncbi:MAG: TraB/GumN family protein [Neomegalonema sp.]|nr:TraB/GumN family protein [Neomegalonema sp.]